MLETTHFIDVGDISASELDRVLTRIADTKFGDDETQFAQTTLTMLFRKPSTQTRISFGTGMTELGGHVLLLSPENIQLGHGESLSDTARVLGCYGDVVMIRLSDHGDLLEITEHSDVPIINGLVDDVYPCQTLADLPTVHERVGDSDEVQAAWVGNGNNAGQSFALGRAMTGIDLAVATPPACDVDDDMPEKVAELGSAPTTTTGPEEAVTDADVVYTDVWTSMGQEDQRHEKLQAFKGLQFDEDLFSGIGAKVVHYLLTRHDEEITGDVLEDKHSLVWGQAENRLHAQRGLIIGLLEE